MTHIVTPRKNAAALSRVLVIDADPGTLVLAGTAMHQGGGVEVYLARGMEDGLERLKELAPQVLVLDFALLKNVPKAKVDDLLKNIDLDATWAILGAKEKTAEVEALLSGGFKAWLSKPYNPRTVGDDIRKLTGKPASASLPPPSSAHLNAEIKRILSLQPPKRQPA